MASPFTAKTTSDVGLSGTVNIDALLTGIKWTGPVGTGTELTYSFPWTGSATATFAGPGGSNVYSSLGEPSNGTALSVDQCAATRNALQARGNVADVSFSEAIDTATVVGDIRIAMTSVSNGDNVWGWAYFPDSTYPSGGDIWISSLGLDPTDSWSAGAYNFEALLHEIGHALGLKHPFEDGVTLPNELKQILHWSLIRMLNCPFLSPYGNR